MIERHKLEHRSTPCSQKRRTASRVIWSSNGGRSFSALKIDSTDQTSAIDLQMLQSLIRSLAALIRVNKLSLHNIFLGYTVFSRAIIF